MRKRLAVFMLSIVLMLVTISFFGFWEVLGILSGSNLYFLLLGLFCQLIIIFLYGCRLKIICSKYKRISIKEALHISIIWNFVSLVTPIAKIGGQPLMIYMLKGGIGGEKSSAVVMLCCIINSQLALHEISPRAF